MNTLTLVPIGDLWVNPEEIAAIAPGYTDGSVITLRNNQIAVCIKGVTPDEVVRRLQAHFGPTYDLPSEVASAVEIAQILAPYYPKYAPTTVVNAVEQIVTLLKK